MRAVKRGGTSSTYDTLITAMNSVLQGWHRSMIERWQLLMAIGRGPKGVTSLQDACDDSLADGEGSRIIPKLGGVHTSSGQDRHEILENPKFPEQQEGHGDERLEEAYSGSCHTLSYSSGSQSISQSWTSSKLGSLAVINESSAMSAEALDHENDKQLVLDAILRENPSIDPNDVISLCKASRGGKKRQRSARRQSPSPTSATESNVTEQSSELAASKVTVNVQSSRWSVSPSVASAYQSLGGIVVGGENDNVSQSSGRRMYGDGIGPTWGVGAYSTARGPDADGGAYSTARGLGAGQWR